MAREGIDFTVVDHDTIVWKSARRLKVLSFTADEAFAIWKGGLGAEPGCVSQTAALAPRPSAE